MILRRLVLLFILAAGLNACSTAAVSESPVSYTNPEGERVEALSMTSPRANAASIRLSDGRVLICGGTATAKVGGVLSSAELYDSNTRRFISTGAMTVERMVSLFESSQKDLQQTQLGMNLIAVCCQRLAKRREGKGRVPVVEIMMNTPIVRKYILDGEFEKLKGTVGNREAGCQS